MPADWPVSNDPTTLAKIQGWLDEVGTRPGLELMGQGGRPVAGEHAARHAQGISKEGR
jgi:hypothetical protein